MFDSARASRQIDPVLGEFFGGTHNPSQPQIDFLIRRHNVPPAALGRDTDGGGMVIGAADVVFDHELFDWAPAGKVVETTLSLGDGETSPTALEGVSAPSIPLYEGGAQTPPSASTVASAIDVVATTSTSWAMSALVFVARGDGGDPLDLIAWSPRADIIASRFGRAPILGEHEVHQPRFDDPLPVHRTIMNWLKAGRTGVVIVQPAKAWRALEGVTLLAENVEHGLELREQLTGPTPRIVVPSSSSQEAA